MLKKGSYIFVLLILLVLGIPNSTVYAQQANGGNPWVVSSFGGDYRQNGIHISSTAGEPFAGTGWGSDNLLYTTGFQQPNNFGPLDIFHLLEPQSCKQSSDARIVITSIEGSMGPYALQWENGDTSRIRENLSTGVYTLTVATRHAISRKEIFVAESNEECPITIYNVITPNGDGDNDQWNIPELSLPYFESNTVELRDRYGSVVWSASNYDNRDVVWRGDNRRGEPLPGGTYFYRITAGNKDYSGYIELIR